MMQSRCFSIGDLALSSLQILPGHGTSSDGNIVAGSFDNSIYVFSSEFGNVVQQVRGAHMDAVSALSLCGSSLVTGSWDALVKLWALTPSGISNLPVMTLAEHDCEVKAVCISGPIAASLACDGTVKLFDIRTGGAVAEQQELGATCIRLLDGGRALAYGEHGAQSG
eukprot:CAMPEP_0180326248 /NCGR_PEP_ID=MMETSP0988-20121125/38873_1 /TAXON_ID=697907 /ORGANISM="non described non described, Strain CCMP2293" /LENGTH=166 /DNA_ID=CAMNT_0022312765 /DNA_START=3 /DNA_END=499 /DNA_ORIENTATION=+